MAKKILERILKAIAYIDKRVAIIGKDEQEHIYGTMVGQTFSSEDVMMELKWVKEVLEGKRDE